MTRSNANDRRLPNEARPRGARFRFWITRSSKSLCQSIGVRQSLERSNTYRHDVRRETPLVKQSVAQQPLKHHDDVHRREARLSPPPHLVFARRRPRQSTTLKFHADVAILFCTHCEAVATSLRQVTSRCLCTAATSPR